MNTDNLTDLQEWNSFAEKRLTVLETLTILNSRHRDRLAKAVTERDEAREELDDWRNAAAHVESNHSDEVHCTCVPILQKLLADARNERDEARAEIAELSETVKNLIKENKTLHDRLERCNKALVESQVALTKLQPFIK